MNLYYVQRLERIGYDTYDSMVVAAESEADARKTHPGGDPVEDPYRLWTAAIDRLQVRLIGTAAEDVKAGVICSSFNAG